jgi:LPS O-antigen subunit length determinant protein (WzzB/FepE family)
MKKTFIFLTLLCLLNGCVESVALLGSTAGGASSGRIFQSSLNSAISYGVKKQTGKTPLGHAISYAEEVNPEKKKEKCISFVEKTRSEFCTVIKKQISLTNTKIKEKTLAVVKKPVKTKNIDVEAKVIKQKDTAKEEKKNFFDIIFESKNSPRQLAIAIQTKIIEKSKNNYLSKSLFTR